MLDLSNPNDRKILSNQILSDIDKHCVDTYQEGHRNHLGASLMGEKCDRKLWYNFRWVKQETFNGRMHRLFQVGHQAEPRLITYLRAIGFEVWERDHETNKQFRMTGCNGHYGGSLDGMCTAPERYKLSEKLVFLNEFKTNGTGVEYSNVEKDGVEKAKPRHFAQMSQYGKFFKLKYGLYIIENKNDSDLTIKIVPLDWNLATMLENRASDIISSKTPPSRISDNPSFFDCKFCAYLDQCHYNEPVEINCRSCKMASPVDNGEWFCNRFQQVIPKNFIKTGCPDHLSVTE